MTESEAQAIRFTIDHYEPKSARKDLEDDYSNLMYCCDECNMRKGDRYPPNAAREAGYRFFRPDSDIRTEHFEPAGIRVNHKSNIGEYTIEAVDLNRQSLRRLRDIRTRLTNCETFVSDGLLALRSFHIDQLPPIMKTRAVNAIHRLDVTARDMAGNVDDVLEKYAKSPVLDDNESEDFNSRKAERERRLRGLVGLFPGLWRASQKSTRAKKKTRKK
jgi:HNH endonuclease